MTALTPTPNATAEVAQLALPDSPALRSRERADRTAMPPAWAQLVAAIVATSLIWLSAGFIRDGFGWAALILLPLAAAIFLGSVLPDLIVARWERAGR